MALFLVDKIEDLVVLDNVKDDEVYYNINLEKYDLKDIEEIVKRFETIKTAPYPFKVSINAYDKNFNENDFAFFITLNKRLSPLGIDLRFSQDHKNDYTLEELMKADAVLDSFISSINVDTLSPLEKFLSIYIFLAKRKYTEEENREEAYKSRDIISVTNSEYIVCEGFANLLSYLSKNVGIDCFVQVLSLENETTNLHANNLVYIDDDKYDVHGLYYTDVTWDAGYSRDWIKSYAFCLLPLIDVKKLRLPIDVSAFFHIFYSEKEAEIRISDSDNSFVGSNICGYPPYYFSYLKSYAETILGIDEIVKDSFPKAIKIYLEHYQEAINKLKDIFLIRKTPSNIYNETPGFNVPFGSSLPYLIAHLCLFPEDEKSIIEGIEALEKHLEKPMDDKDEIYGGEILPYARDSNLYKSLDTLLLLKEEDIDLPYEEIDRRAVEQVFTFEKLSEDFDCYLSQKRTYSNLLKTIDRLRNMLIFPIVTKLIKERYPLGKPIPLNTLAKALQVSYKQIEKNDKDDYAQKIYDSLANSHMVSKSAFDKDATNAIRQMKEIDLIKAVLTISSLVRRYEEDEGYIKIITNILLGKSNDYLNLYIIFEDDGLYLTDSNNIYMIMDDYYPIDEDKYNRVSEINCLTNDNFRLYLKTHHYSLVNDLKKFEGFVKDIMKRST